MLEKFTASIMKSKDKNVWLRQDSNSRSSRISLYSNYPLIENLSVQQLSLEFAIFLCCGFAGGGLGLLIIVLGVCSTQSQDLSQLSLYSYRLSVCLLLLLQSLDRV